MKILQWIWIMIIFVAVTIKSANIDPVIVEIAESNVPVIESLRQVQQSEKISEVYDPINDIYYTIESFNQLPRETFDNFTGIGPVIAENIFNYILETGGIKSFDDLLNVSGIGEKKLNGILENSK